ncbi:transposase [Geodermatophilus amargosae]|uniref:transposase n=1 Tax=Geodermatophilus amargosae TaxID=1296565 RepID=UPI0034DF550E
MNTSRLGASQGGGHGWADGKYPEESRQRATQLVLDSRRSSREVAAELGVTHETLSNWVAAESRNRAAGPAALGTDERLELVQLRRRIAELELEREVLRRARSSSPGRRGGESRSPRRVHRRGEDDLRRAPPLPHPRHQPDPLLRLGRPGRRPLTGECTRSSVTHVLHLRSRNSW